MSLAGSAAVAIWHDIAPEGRDEFYAWHGMEHMPERVGIPGFLRGRRYIALEADLEYFNLYEAHAPEVLTGPDYQSRVNNPTPWTSSTVKHFRRVARSICRVGATFGAGQGGLIWTCRYDVAPAKANAHVDTLATSLLPDLAGEGAIAGAHLLIADTEASAAGNAEEKARGEANRVPSWIILVESWGDGDAFTALCQRVLSDDALVQAGASGPIHSGLYQLQATIALSDLERPAEE